MATFDAEVPRQGSKTRSAGLRNNFNALNKMIVAIPVGPAGEVTAQQLNDAMAGTSANSNSVQMLDTSVDLAITIAKLDELIRALRR